MCPKPKKDGETAETKEGNASAKSWTVVLDKRYAWGFAFALNY